MKKRTPVFRCFLCFLALALMLPIPALAADAAPEPESGRIQILLVGQDGAPDTPSRSDSIILCTIYPETKTVCVTSFLRDLYLPIPGHQSNRLNAAYAYGGMELLKQTLKTHFDIQPDGCVEVDFSSFPGIIDLLGGVKIDLRQDEADAINRSVPGALTAGVQLLSGQQALAYSRIRKLDQDGDISRSSRQRKLIASLMDSYRSASLLTILSTVSDLLPMLSTDLSKRELFVLAAKLFPLLDDPVITSHRIPADGTYTCRRIDGMDVLVADLEENREKLAEFLLPVSVSGG